MYILFMFSNVIITIYLFTQKRNKNSWPVAFLKHILK